MTSPRFDAKQFVADFERAFESKDLTKALTYYDADAETPGPDGKMQRGLDGFRRGMEHWMNAFTDTKVELKEIVQDGNNVALLQRCTAVHTGDFEIQPGEKIAATNKRVSFDIAEFIRLNDTGKIVRDAAMMDGADLMRQLGALPNAGQRAASERAVQR